VARVVQVFWCRRITEIATISADGRKTLVELNKAIKNIDQHPTRLIFGR
jgi:hypothetical protein